MVFCVKEFVIVLLFKFLVFFKILYIKNNLKIEIYGNIVFDFFC